jgi:hypothetical protein
MKKKNNGVQEARAAMKGMVDEARVQAHLGVMDVRKKVGPYLAEVQEASKGVARDLAKRGRQLRTHLKELKRR